MNLRKKLIELSLRRMNIDRLAVIYLLISAFYPVLKPSAFPDPWANAILHGGLALLIWFVPPLVLIKYFFRDTPRRGFTRGPFWSSVCWQSNWRTSGKSCARAEDCLRIPIPG